MSRRGEIVIACDTPTCHAEQVYTADDLLDRAVEVALHDDGWRPGPYVTALTYRCPQCAEEGK